MELDPTRLEALCLDLDDTILDSEGSVRAAWELVADRLVEAHPELARSAVLAAIESATDWFWADDERHRRGRLDLPWARREVVGRALETLQRRPDAALADAVGRAYTELRERELWLFEGALDVLARLRARVPRMALVTNGAAETQRAKIERFDLARFFDHVQIEGEFGAGKPDALVYRHVLGRLDAAPHASLMVGDNFECDVLGPLAVGMHAAWIDAAGRGAPAVPAPRPHWTLRSLHELAARLGV
ncbi:MAG TPA: HAD-IA family hydrolase [Myxococcota bacterium]|jgi:putative hydrolase of the HAD superfamily|nr:HAD-IA family hydrolase [Myxococcota bacterium]